MNFENVFDKKLSEEKRRNLIEEQIYDEDWNEVISGYCSMDHGGFPDDAMPDDLEIEFDEDEIIVSVYVSWSEVQTTACKECPVSHTRSTDFKITIKRDYVDYDIEVGEEMLEMGTPGDFY